MMKNFKIRCPPGLHKTVPGGDTGLCKTDENDCESSSFKTEEKMGCSKGRDGLR